METLWSQLLAHGIEVEETELTLDEFEHLFCEQESSEAANG